MGNCCGSEESDSTSPDINERRRLQAEAAEKRHQDNESRGLKDPDGARRRMEAKSAAAAAMEGRQDSREGGMKWQVG